MLPTVTHPTFDTVIPSTKETVKFRPFLVKEHKMLLKAVEFNNPTNLIETFKSLINTCTFGAIDVSKLAMFDIEYLFLKIKGASAGSVTPVKYTCGAVVDGEECGETININLNTDNAYVDIPEGVDDIIKVSDGVGLKLKYPSFDDYVRRGGDKTALEMSEEFVIDCVELVFDKESVYLPGKDFTRDEIREFIDNLTEDDALKITTFIESIPQVEMKVPIRCHKCGNTDELHLRGLDDFLE